MNRRTACLCFLVALKTSLVSSFVLAAQEAAQAVSRIAGPRWNVDGDWDPSIEEIQSHLRSSHGIDPGGFDLEDLLILHDNDHNRRGYRRDHGHTKRPAKGYARH